MRLFIFAPGRFDFGSQDLSAVSSRFEIGEALLNAFDTGAN